MTDIEIARNYKPKKIVTIAKKLGLTESDLILYGKYKAKIDKKVATKKSNLILVTAINPTKAGEGKTTVSIGLADALSILHKKVCLALREPSLGPVFGVKGGATGGGLSQVVPMEDINLHFNGDFHAITSANNLLCALIDNHIFQGNALNINPDKVLFNRCLDMNDRALREIEIFGRQPRKEKFVITAASEVMAILCLAENLEDLKERLGKIIVGLNYKNEPVYAKDLSAQDSMAILLNDALKPNLVQTLKGTPAIIHCGPFANIAHGCNSIVATKMACSLADFVVTEAGFGSDLGAEKFLDFKCRIANLKPSCVVIVATIRALKLHGGVKIENVKTENLQAVKMGYANLQKHIDTIKNVFKLPYVVTLNKFDSDTQKEIALLKELVGDDLVVNEVWAKGGKGGLILAEKVIEQCQKDNSKFSFSYDLNESVENKIKDIVVKIYGGKEISLSKKSKESLDYIYKLGLNKIPIIIAKTQYSLSADEHLLGAPKDFVVEIEDIEIRNGAGFLVVICGKIMLMPGLSKEPAATKMTIDNHSIINGLF
ncbi:MAG: formate--tetrahydrofolate ligase [Clostridia bacterium]